MVKWHGKKMVCEQVGEKKCRGWTHWMEEDKLHLVRQEYVRLQKNESNMPTCTVEACCVMFRILVA